MPLQDSSISCFTILRRERESRAHFGAVRSLYREQELTENVLGLLLPLTLLVKMLEGSSSGGDGGDDPKALGEGAATDACPPPEDAAPAPAHAAPASPLGLMSLSSRQQHFAEQYDSASVLFAEGGGCRSQAHYVIAPCACLCRGTRVSDEYLVRWRDTRGICEGGYITKTKAGSCTSADNRPLVVMTRDPPTVIQNEDVLQLSPEARLQILDRAFLRFDDIVSRSKALKIETVAGVYLVAANSAWGAGGWALVSSFVSLRLAYSMRVPFLDRP